MWSSDISLGGWFHQRCRQACLNHGNKMRYCHSPPCFQCSRFSRSLCSSLLRAKLWRGSMKLSIWSRSNQVLHVDSGSWNNCNCYIPCSLDCHIQDMLVPIADLKASIELFHREVICHQSAFLALRALLKPDFNLVYNILSLYFAGGNLPNMALSLQAAFSPRHAQASHQQGNNIWSWLFLWR